MTARADQLRQARLEFQQAMALGCSIIELRRRRLADRQHLRARAHGDVAAHTQTLVNGPSEASERAFLAPDCPWMMRN